MALPINIQELLHGNTVEWERLECKQGWPDKLEILSFPGPVPPVNATVLKTQKRIVSREYRNRRIGDFLKELGLTEGRGTGFPTIYKAMADNGSPDPTFETDNDFTCFLSILPAHSLVDNQESSGESDGVTVLLFNNLEDIMAFSNGVGNGASSAIDVLNVQIHDRVSEVLNILLVKMKREVLFETLRLSNQTRNRIKYLDPLIKLGWIDV